MIYNTGSTSQKNRRKKKVERAGKVATFANFARSLQPPRTYVNWSMSNTLVNIPDGIFHANNFADPLFSLVATATRASSLPIPDSLLEGWLLLKKSVPGLGLLWYPSDCDAYSSISDLAVIDSPGNGCVLFETYRMRMGYDAVRCTRCCAQWRGGTQERPLMGCEHLHYYLNPPGMCE